MKWSVGAKIAAGFSLALLILVTLGVNSWLSTRRLVQTNRAVAETYDVLGRLENAFSLLKDAESGNRGYIITGKDEYLAQYDNALVQLPARLAEVRSLTKDSPNQQQRLDALGPLIEQRLGLLAEGIRLRKEAGDKGFKSAADHITRGGGIKAMESVRAVVADISKEERDQLAARIADAEASAARTEALSVYGVPAALVVLALAAHFINRNISRPLREVTGVAGRVASGDLTVSVNPGRRADEVGVLAQTFAAMVESLRRVTSDITEAASVLTASAGEIVSTTAQLASGASQTATAVAETTTTVEEVRQTAQVANQKARYVSETSQKASQIALGGKKSTEGTVEGMVRIREQMSSIAQSMVRLSEQTQAIGQIIATVDDLAQQSNLLAVNASIEAAKAGEQGKGFAVVAQEVKSLAEQSKQATTQVRTILSDIQKATGAAVMATEQGTKAVEAGVSQSSAAGDSIQSLASSINEATAAASQIAASSQQQLVGMDQVVQAMDSIKQASVQNVDGARQLEAAAKGLEALGQRLKELVGRYKLTNGQAP